MGSKLVQKQKRASLIKNQAVAKAIELLEKRVLFATFSPGSVIVEQLGQNATTTTSVPITLDEYSSSGTALQQLTLPTSGTGLISDNGNSGANGFISLAANGSAIEVPGFAAAPGTATVITGTTNPRVIDSVDAFGNVTQPVSSTTAFSGTYIRGATSDGLGNYYASGPTQGINYLGTGTPAIVETQTTNTRQIVAINGNLYYTTSSATAGISGLYEVGTGGYPTAAGTTATQIISQGGTTGAPYGIAISPDGKTIYLADSRSVATGGGVQKYTSTTGAAGSFTLAYTFGADGLGLTEGDQGLAVDFSGANPIIYTTTSESAGATANKFVKIVDPGNATAAASTNGTLLATSTGGPSGYVFRGVALSPAVAPAITSVAPLMGTTGTTVTITGSGFTGATSVLFGTTSATGFSVSPTGTSITVPAPSGSGTVNITVTTAFGSGTTSAAAGDQFSYTVAPVVSSITPNNFGATTGTNLVTINGSNFTATAANTTVKFGTVLATNVTVVSSSILTATVPAESAGAVDVTVTIGGVTSSTSSADTYTYYDNPTITSLSLTTGLDGGNQAITINGTNFSPGSTVSFGGIPATSVVVVSSTVITAVTPAAATQGPSMVGVTVTNTKTTSAATNFNYILTTVAAVESVIPSLAGSGPTVTLDSNPVITQVLEVGGDSDDDGNGVSRSYTYTAFLVQDSTGSLEIFVPTTLTPAYNPVVGNTITATGIPVYFNGTPELGGNTSGALTALSTTSTGATVPPTQVKTIPAIDPTPSTTPPPLPLNVAGYPITVQGVDITFPATTPATTTFGTASLTGTITDTAGNSMVLYYSTSSNEAAFNNLATTTIPSNLVNITGFLSTATINSVVTTEFNLISISANTVAPVLTSLNPAGGPPNVASPSSLITITGNGFMSPTVSNVYFGGTSHPASFTVVSDTIITASAPSEASGTVQVTVVNTNGTSNSLSFVYGNTPIVTGVVPTAIPANAPMLVTINGTDFTGATSVTFGTGHTVTTGITVNAAGTQLTVTAPSESAGTVDVIVATSGGGAGTANANDKLTFAVTPVVTTITPSQGSVVGGTSVTITGSGFVVGATTVSVNGTALTSGVTISSTTQIIFTSPAYTGTVPASGQSVTVAVTTVGGTGTGSFTYVPANIQAAETQGSGTVTLTSNPVITEIYELKGTSANGKTYTNNNFLVQDSSGSTSVFGNFPTGSTFVPIVGHTISVTGTYVLYQGNPEIETITAIADTGTGTAAYPNPLTETVPTVNVATPVLGAPPTGYGEYLITLNNVTIGGLTAGNSFGTAGNLTGTISDGTHPSLVLYYAVTSFEDANNNLALMAIPSSTTHVNVTGIATTFNGTAEFDLINVTPYVSSGPSWFSGTYSQYTAGSSITITSGTIIGDPGAAGDGSIAITVNGPLNVNLPAGTTTIHTGSVTINSGDTFTLSPPSGLSTTPPIPILITSNLAISGKFDIANGFVDLVNGGESLATATTSVSTGFDGGKWDGAGIISSTALASPLHGVGVISATGSVPTQTTLDGYTFAAGDVLLKYTYFGDADLNGKVDATDYTRIDNGFINHLSGWYNGDFNYDTVVNGSDYTLMDNAYNRQTGVIPSAVVVGVAAPDSVVFTPGASTASSTFSDKKIKESLADEVDALIG